MTHSTRILAANEPGIPDHQLDRLLDHLVESLNQGQLVAFPTDTVYGLAARVSDPEGIQQLYRVKERDNLKAIPVLLGRTEDLNQVTGYMSEKARKLAERFWPGALTLVVSRHPSLPEILSHQPTIGVRMPHHPVALALLRRTGPLAVTSANLSGGANTTTAEEVLAQLDGRIALILDGGKTPGGSPSTVVDCTGDQPLILRQGPISLEAIQAALEE